MLNEGKVHLSTFWHFRAHEQAEIGDPDDGQVGFMFKNDTSDPWTIEPELLDAAAMSVPGHPRFHESKTLMPGDESWVEAAGGFDTFMYSLTEAAAPSKKLMERLGYDSAVEVTDVGSFMDHTGQALRQFGFREFGFDRHGYTRVRCQARPIAYVESKRRVVTPSTVDVLNETRELTDTEFFTKLKAFEHQSEFRIAYFFMNPDTETTASLDVRLPQLYPVVIGDKGLRRIAETLRKIDQSEFVD